MAVAHDQVDEVIEQALVAARQITGLDLAFVGAFVDGREVLEAIVGEPDRVGLELGDAGPLEDTFCQRMVDGRIDQVVPDTAKEPQLEGLGGRDTIGAYVGVPIRLRGGRLYGSLCAVAANPVDGLSGEHVASLRILAHVIAERLDQAVEDSARQRAQDEFFAAITHDLRGPLTPIRGYAELLRVDAGDPARVLEAADAIQRNADQLGRLVDDLLTVAQARSGQFRVRRRTVDVQRIVADAVADATRGRERTVTLDAPAGPVEISGDAGRLRQLLDNLVSNALKYSDPADAVLVTLADDGATVVLAVADRGIGIDPDELARLFDLYTRARTALRRDIPGIGIGLAICQAIVTAHEGTITVDSTPGAGTTFTVRLPRAPRT